MVEVLLLRPYKHCICRRELHPIVPEQAEWQSLHQHASPISRRSDQSEGSPKEWSVLLDFLHAKESCRALRLVHPNLGTGFQPNSDFEPDDLAPRDVLAEEANVRSSKGKGIDLGDIEFSVDDSILPGWDPDLAFGDGSGSSEAPIPDFDVFFAGVPSSFDPPPSVVETGRSKVVAEGSRIINGVSLSLIYELFG